jgi:hypothetical protein
MFCICVQLRNAKNGNLGHECTDKRVCVLICIQLRIGLRGVESQTFVHVLVLLSGTDTTTGFVRDCYREQYPVHVRGMNIYRAVYRLYNCTLYSTPNTVSYVCPITHYTYNVIVSCIVLYSVLVLVLWSCAVVRGHVHSVWRFEAGMRGGAARRDPCSVGRQPSTVDRRATH